MDHPLQVFDGGTDQFITAILRRLVRRLRQRWPHVTIGVRADAGFAKPEI